MIEKFIFKVIKDIEDYNGNTVFSKDHIIEVPFYLDNGCSFLFPKNCIGVYFEGWMLHKDYVELLK